MSHAILEFFTFLQKGTQTIDIKEYDDWQYFQDPETSLFLFIIMFVVVFFVF